MPRVTNTYTGWASLLFGHNGWKSLALAGGTALHATNIYLATTILPSIVSEIGGLRFYAWNTTLFMMASIIGSVLSSRVLFSQGAKAGYRMASLIFATGSLICALAPAMPVLLLGRFVQGFGGGILFALSYAMIRLVFEQGLWPRAMALVSGMWGLAALSGPFVGGLFAQFNQWRLAFGFLIPLTLLLILITERMLPGKVRVNGTASPNIPWVKLALLTLVALMVSLGSLSNKPLHNLLGVAVAGIILLVVIRLERNPSPRLLPGGAYKLSEPLGIIYTVMLLLVMGTTIEIFAPYLLQVVQQKTPFVAGYLAAFMALGWTLASVVFSGARAKIVRYVLLAGPLVMVLALVGLAYYMPLPEAASGTGFVMVCVCLVLAGAGIGMGWPHLLALVLTSARKGEEELASASITTVQLLATAFGAALSGMIVNLAGLTDPGGIAGAISAAKWLFSIYALSPALSLLLTFRLLKLLSARSPDPSPV